MLSKYLWCIRIILVYILLHAGSLVLQYCSPSSVFQELPQMPCTSSQVRQLKLCIVLQKHSSSRPQSLFFINPVRDKDTSTVPALGAISAWMIGWGWNTDWTVSWNWDSKDTTMAGPHHDTTAKVQCQRNSAASKAWRHSYRLNLNPGIFFGPMNNITNRDFSLPALETVQTALPSMWEREGICIY